jgi:hypothetical protein
MTDGSLVPVTVVLLPAIFNLPTLFLFMLNPLPHYFMVSFSRALATRRANCDMFLHDQDQDFGWPWAA